MSTTTPAPSRPRPTVHMPATPPHRNAIRIAGRSPPSRAAAATRTLPRTQSDMPMNPVNPEASAPIRKKMLRPHCTPGAGGRQQQQDKEDKDDERGQRPELPAQVGRRAILHGFGYFLHLLCPLARRQDLSHQHARDPEGKQCDNSDDHNPSQVGAAHADRSHRSARRKGGTELRHTISFDVCRARLKGRVWPKIPMLPAQPPSEKCAVGGVYADHPGSCSDASCLSSDSQLVMLGIGKHHL